MKKRGFMKLFCIYMSIILICNIAYCFVVSVDAADISPSEKKTFNGHTYEYYNVGTDWKTAYKICERKGGHLATVNSKEENDFIYGLQKKFANSFCWLGGTDNTSEGNWYWITGEPFTYKNWVKNEPNNSDELEHYLQMYLENGEWNDAKYSNTSTDSKSGFVCEYEGNINAAQYTPSKQISYQNSKYEIYDKYKIDWQTAELVSKAKGGHLVVFDSLAENTKIYEAVTSSAQSIFWIGYTDAGTEGVWRNVKGETPKYTNWDTDTQEPNNDQGVEDYAAMEKSRSGKWNDLGAFAFYNGRTIGFICEYEPTINKTSISLKAGEAFTLKVKNGSISNWKSSNTKIATVTSSGKVKAVKKGTATITATLTTGFKLTCNVTVTTSTKVKQKITAKSYTKTYGAKAFNINAHTSGNGKLSYKSNNNKVVKVSSKGKVTIKGCGKATITIKAAATTKYKATSKKIQIIVKPTKIQIVNLKGNRKNCIVYFKKHKTISGYECVFNGSKKKRINKYATSVTIKNYKIGTWIKIKAYIKCGSQKVYGAYGKVKPVFK